MRFLISLILLVSPVIFAVDADSITFEQVDARLDKIEQKQSKLDRELSRETQDLEHRMDQLEDNAAAGIGLFVSGILCALWAQFTRRSAWVWFFFGLFLAPIALVAMVWKNALGLASGDLKFWTRE